MTDLAITGAKNMSIENADRYLRIVAWARKRYARGGWIPVSKGHKPLPYSIVEDIAWRHLMGCHD